MVQATGHIDVAAYVLGVLDEPDHVAFEAHLLDCRRCQFELVELQEVPELLDIIKHDTAPRTVLPVPGPRVLAALLDEATAQRRKHRMRRWIGVAAAVVLIVAGPVITLAVVDRSPAPSTAEPFKVKDDNPAAEPPRVLGTEIPDRGIDATVSLQEMDWGTEIELELRGATGAQRCELVAISKTGVTSPVSNWAPGAGAILKVTGSTSMRTEELARLEVRTEDGTVLVTLPV